MLKMFDAALFKGQERNTLRLWEIQYVSCLWEDRKGDQASSIYKLLYLVDI